MTPVVRFRDVGKCMVVDTPDIGFIDNTIDLMQLLALPENLPNRYFGMARCRFVWKSRRR